MQAQQHFKSWPNEAGFNASAIFNDVRAPVDLDIEGRFPDYVAGSLYRTGPGSYKIPSPGSKDGIFTVRHWFDGFTTTHKFELVRGQGGSCARVLYSSRGQVDKLIEAAKEKGSIGDHVSFAQRDPCESLYRKVKSFFAPTSFHDANGSNIGVVLRQTLPSEKAMINSSDSKGRKILTLTTDNVSAKHFDADTLEPLEVTTQATVHPSLNGVMSASHACTDPVTGDIFNYNLALGPMHRYKIFRASHDGSVEILAEIQGTSVRGAYIHSLALTDNFVVLCVWPAFYRYKGISILWERNVVDSISYEPNADTRWYVIDRKHGRGVVKQFTSPSFFCFHFVNAWEEMIDDTDDVSITCELCEFPDASTLELLQYQHIVSSEAAKNPATKAGRLLPHLARYRLNNVPLHERAGDDVGNAEKIMATPGGDLPSFNPNYALKPHRYVYTVLNRGKSSFLDGLGKTDTTLGTTTIWERERHTPGEPIFIPRPEAIYEDDGVVLSVVLDGDTGNSYLLCLDARRFQEVGRARLDGPVGFGFHGMHLPSTSHL